MAKEKATENTMINGMVNLLQNEQLSYNFVHVGGGGVVASLIGTSIGRNLYSCL